MKSSPPDEFKSLSTRAMLWPLAAVAALMALTVYLLHQQGRLWLCECGYVLLWAGDIWSADNSQQLLDPYSVTHVIHGVIFFWLLAWLMPKTPMRWRFVVAIAVEALWEVVENSAFIIDRYREGTVSLGYTGDTVLNSVSDIALCAAGFVLAYYLGLRRSIALFVLSELILLLWIRDNLILNILMLIHPIDAIRVWQAGL